METIRAFIAINLDPEIRGYLSSLQQNLNLDAAKVKVNWVEEKNLHLTLKFLGNISPSQIELIEIELKKITSQYPSFFIKLLPEIGVFPSYKMPRVIWVGIKEGAAELTEIYNLVETRLYKKGFPRESKNFSTHITLGRVKYLKDKDSLIRSLKSIHLDSFSQKVKSIELMESKLTPQGPLYGIIRQYPLAD